MCVGHSSMVWVRASSPCSLFRMCNSNCYGRMACISSQLSLSLSLSLSPLSLLVKYRECLRVIISFHIILCVISSPSPPPPPPPPVRSLSFLLLFLRIFACAHIFDFGKPLDRRRSGGQGKRAGGGGGGEGRESPRGRGGGGGVEGKGKPAIFREREPNET